MYLHMKCTDSGVLLVLARSRYVHENTVFSLQSFSSKQISLKLLSFHFVIENWFLHFFPRTIHILNAKEIPLRHPFGHRFERCSLKLTDRAKDYCGILSYIGSSYYRYEIMPMGLSISSCKCIQYIEFVMEKLHHPENYITIMDDLLDCTEAECLYSSQTKCPTGDTNSSIWEVL